MPHSNGQSNGHASRGVVLDFEAYFDAVRRPPFEPRPAPPPGQRVLIPQARESIATILSPSQVWTLQDCAARWYFGKVLGLPDPKNANLALGSAVDAALSFNFRQKIESGKDLELAAIGQEYAKAWKAEACETEFRDDEDPDELAAQGLALTRLYMERQAPHIQPAAVQEHVEGEIAGVRVQGYLDIRERNGRLRDIKVNAKKSKAATCSQKFQLATYAALSPDASGQLAIDQLVKTKTPDLNTLDHVMSDADRDALEHQYPVAQALARGEVYMPNRNSNLCNRRNCSFWRACQREFGGEIPE